ncbi:TIGR02099 family protein [Polynucleobacter meluiroseus]|uniref:TIGR02099 family protein n=2 Tax=Polynucleobacter meluiroseus TaxID=1938814 RepID=A0A240DXP5_9BURK|nr:TIGR02099 family protein [Polynucleobacter meluiroseus]
MLPMRAAGTPGQWAKRALILLGICLALLVCGHLAIRYVVWPQIEKSRPALEKLLSARLGTNVTMDDVRVSWTGIRPSFEIEGLRFAGLNKAPSPLYIEKISGQLSWSSVYKLSPYFYELTLSNAQVYAQRDAKGIVSVAGIALGGKPDDYSGANWLFSQNDIQINRAQIFWNDQLSKKLQTSIEIQNLHLDNGIRSHQANLTMVTPWSKTPIQLQTDFVHRLGGQAGNWRDWVGNISWDISSLNFASLGKDFALPLYLLEGVVSSKGQLKLDSGKADGAKLFFGADQLVAQLHSGEEPLEFGRLEANLTQETDGKLLSISAESLAWRDIGSDSNAPLEKLSPMIFRWRPPGEDGEIKEFGFSSPKILVEDIAVFALNLPLPKKIRQSIKLSQATGELKFIDLNWAEKKSALGALPLPGSWFSPSRLDFTVSASLNDVSFIGFNSAIPTISHLTGNVTSNQTQGSFTLDSQNLEVKIADLLVDPKIQLDRAKGSLSWTKQKGGWLINGQKLALSNAELDTTLDISYLLADPKKADFMTLDMKFDKAQLTSVHRYLPVGLSKEVQQYLGKAFEGGIVKNGSLHIQGDPNQAPYSKGKPGQLSLHLPLIGATFKPAPLLSSNQGVWAALSNVGGSVDMENSHLQVKVDKASYKKVALENIQAEIKDVSANQPTLLINGVAAGSASEILEYVFLSPVGKKQPSLEKNLKVSGLLNVNLGLKIPLSNSDDSNVDAKVTLNGNKAQWGDIPPLENLQGKLKITETNPEFEDISATFLGGGLKISSAASAPENTSFKISGDMQSRIIKDYFARHPQSQVSPIFTSMSGTAKYEGAINFNKLGSQTNLQFDFRNWGIAAPKPINKLIGAPMQGQLFLRTYRASGTGKGASSAQADWNGKIDDQYFLAGNLDAANDLHFALGIGTNVTPTQEDFAISYVGNDLNIDAWQNFMASGKSSIKETGHKQSTATDPTVSINAQIKKLIAFDRVWNDFSLTANNKNNVWQFRPSSPNIAGELDWHPANTSSTGDLISGRLSRLHIPDEAPKKSNLDTAASSHALKKCQKPPPAERVINPNMIPSLNLTIDDFAWIKAQLGTVKIKTKTTQDSLKIESIQLANPQGSSVITGQWQGNTAGSQEQSTINVDMEIKDAGAIIAHWTSPKTVDGGQGRLSAKLNWLGPIFAPHYETLNGTVNIDLAKGRLLEVNTSGAKLLDVLSLQSLLKFATLDLQGTLGNLATKGTPFNTITSNFEIKQGIADTKEFTMNLDQARVAMNGQINIPLETQDLRITIFPTIDAAAGSLAAFAINPLLGLGVLAGQYLITNQINRTMQSDYLIQGSWSNPEIIPLDQKGQPLDKKTLDSIRSKGLLKEQAKPNSSRNLGTQPAFAQSPQAN